MSILVFILKIIGILFFILLFFAGLFLFHPIFYQARGEAEEELSAEGYFWWLFQILRLEFQVGRQQTKFRIRIFGRSIELGEKEEMESPLAESEAEETSARTASGQDEKDSVRMEPDGIANENEDTPEDSEEFFGNFAEEKEMQEEKKKSPKKKKKGGLSKIGRLRAQTADSGNRQAVSHLWKEICFLLSRMKPKYLKAELSFSAGDPAATGGVVGALSLIPAVYRYDARIYPDFLSEKLYIKGKLEIKGHMALYHFILSLFRLLRDKNIRRLYNNIRK